MCGVIGYRPSPVEGTLDDNKILFQRLLEESRIRGTHAYGIASRDRNTGLAYARRSHDIAEIVGEFDPLYPSVSHTRYSTSGDWQDHRNNQPIIVGNTALAFNGVIDMGTKVEFEERWGVKCESDNDGEIFLRRVVDHARDPAQFLMGLEGSFAGVMLTFGSWGERMFAGRNERRPLWKFYASHATWYVSTLDIARRAGLLERADWHFEMKPGWEEA